MLRHFLHSCYKIQARKDKDLTSKMGLNLAEYLRQKKRDGFGDIDERNGVEVG